MEKLFSNLYEDKNYNKVVFDKDNVIEGVNILGKAVGATLGAQGRTTLVETDEGIKATKDGAYTASHINLEDKEQQLGLATVRQAASETSRVEGDGTTTCTVLAQSIINNIYGEDRNPSVRLISGVADAASDVISYLDNETHQLNEDTILNIAVTSANNDKEIGGLVAGVYGQIGTALGVNYIWDPNSTKTTSEVIRGSILNLGYGPQKEFITNIESQTVEFVNPLMLISNANIEKVEEITSILEYAIKEKRSLLIIGNVSGEATAAFVSNKLDGKLESCILNSRGIFDSESLRDLAALTGAKFFDTMKGDSLDTITPDYLGTADKVSVSDSRTIFTKAEPGDVEDRVAFVKKKLKESENSTVKRQMKDRLAILEGGFGVIKVGAPTRAESLEVMDRVEDSIKAVSSSLDGFIAGGGSVLFRATDSIEAKPGSGDYAKGYNLLLKSIKEPYYRICGNAGIEPIEELGKDEGLNVLTGKVIDMVDAGIIDPVNVTKAALTNALSSAKIILRTGSIITATKSLEQDEQKED